MAPPARRSAQAEQTSGLGGQAVDRHELLLLAHRAEESQCVPAEADQPERAQREQAEPRAHRHAHPLAGPYGREHDERQQEPGRDLDADARHQRACRGAEARAGSGGERQRRRERENDQRVVVRAAYGQLEQHRVQSQERHRHPRRAAEAAGGPPDERHGAEARGDRQGLERPQAASRRERGREVASEREEGTVWRVLEGPSHEWEHRVGWRFGPDVGVGVEAVHRPQACEVQVAEDVLGDQRRSEQQDRVGRHDRRDDRPHGEHARRGQHRQIARAHEQHQGLKARRADAHSEALQRTGHPVRPAAAASRNVGGGPRGGSGGDQEHAGHHPQQAESAQRTKGPDPARRAAARVYAIVSPGGDPGAWYGCGGLYALIVTSTRRASVDGPGKLRLPRTCRGAFVRGRSPFSAPRSGCAPIPRCPGGA